MKTILNTFMMLIISVNYSFAQERLALTTDRDIYIGGEEVWLTIQNYKNDEYIHSGLSKVVYIELINNDKIPVVQEKVYINKGRTTSRFVIPDSVSTGSYLLRAYTNWMTNFSAHDYEKKLISIINPFTNNALSNIESKTKNNDNSLRINNSLIANEIKDLRDVYSSREKVIVNIPSELTQWKNVTVSVVKSCLINNHKLSRKRINIPANNGYNQLLEYKSEIVTGIITDIDTHKPIANERFVLSFVGQEAIFKISDTDSLGRFAFEVNQFGESEMVIQPYSSDTTKLNYKVTLDDKFSAKFEEFSIPDLTLDSSLIKQINSAIVNMQINTIYSGHKPDLAFVDSIRKVEAFYGEPEHTVIIDKYIELATTEEVIRELVPFVALKRQKGKYFIRVYEDQSLYPKDGSTLTFVDGVPVHNVDRILDISSKYLSKIEVLNLNYYYHDMNLGRLVMFQTIDGDMGNMDFDRRIFRQAHHGFLNSYTFQSPLYESDKLLNSRLADFRNVLYYRNFDNNEIQQNPTITFYTGDDKSEYALVFTGINQQGEQKQLMKSFKVK